MDFRATDEFVLALAAGAGAGARLLLPYVLRDWHNFIGQLDLPQHSRVGAAGFITNLPNKRVTLLSVLSLDRERLPAARSFSG